MKALQQGDKSSFYTVKNKGLTISVMPVASYHCYAQEISAMYSTLQMVNN